MQSVRRLVAILSLAGFSALGSQVARGQEGGFQVPVNEPAPDTPGFFKPSFDFMLWHDPVFFGRQARPPLRKPKPGEHLGEYLVAESLPSHLPPVGEVQLPQTTVPLPPPVPIRYFRMGSWSPEWERPWVPKLGDLPPKPGEHLGEYALAAELPPRYPAVRPNLPAMTVPPGYHLDTGDHRVSSGPPGAVTTPTAPSDRIEFCFRGPGEVKAALQTPEGAFKEGPNDPKRCNLTQGKDCRVRVTSAQPGKPVRALYPLVEVAHVNSKTEAYVRHSAVPVAFTEEEFACAKAGEVVLKVIYLPNPERDFSTVLGAEDVSSVGLKSGVDPIVEARRRGTVLAIIRVGDADFEARTRSRSDER